MKGSEKAKNKWDVQLRKGTLELVILAALAEQELYGLALLNRLHSFETMRISEGTLYPLLDRLKRDGVIDASWRQSDEERPRKYYQLTQKGRDKLYSLTARWRETVQDIEALLQGISQK